MSNELMRQYNIGNKIVTLSLKKEKSRTLIAGQAKKMYTGNMFTGIIEQTGRIIDKTDAKLVIQAEPVFAAKLAIGASVAVDGICLTVTSLKPAAFGVDVMPQTVERTNLKYLKTGDLVNLELPATASSLLSGHIVQGHIDDIARLETVINQGNSQVLKFSLPESLAKYVVEKGSIAVNGISLTVIETGSNYFTVGIIPHTWESTMLRVIKTGDYVNIEVDILAKYIESLLKK